MIEAAFTARAATTADLKTSKAGKAWCAFSAAVSNGTDSTDTTWVRVSCFGSVAEAISEALQKGDKVYCEGRLTLQSYTSKDGQERTGLQLAAHLVTRMGPKLNKPEKQRAPAASADFARPMDTDSRPARNGADSEIPF